MYCDIYTLLTWSCYTTCSLNISVYSKLHRHQHDLFKTLKLILLNGIFTATFTFIMIISHTCSCNSASVCFGVCWNGLDLNQMLKQSETGLNGLGCVVEMIHSQVADATQINRSQEKLIKLQVSNKQAFTDKVWFNSIFGNIKYAAHTTKKLIHTIYCVWIQPLGASDYLEMSRLFDTIFIRHIPQLTLNKKTQARRLITLVDALYDHKVHGCYLHTYSTYTQTPNFSFLFRIQMII